MEDPDGIQDPELMDTGIQEPLDPEVLGQLEPELLIGTHDPDMALDGAGCRVTYIE